MAESLAQPNRFIGLAVLYLSFFGVATAAPFTGPLSDYYLSDTASHRIYVVRGTQVINSFSWAYSAGNAAANNESNLAIANGFVTTNGAGSFYGAPATAGQYTLSGTPTGAGHVAQPTPGASDEVQYDGTSDGQHNYTVQLRASTNDGNTENVIRTDLNWQNPEVLFSVQTTAGAQNQVEGITYDPANNSLWISENLLGTGISDYSLSGTLLSSINPNLVQKYALGLDPADDTLWFNINGGNTLYQFSTTGVFLQKGVPTGLPVGNFLAGELVAAGTAAVAEPASLALLGFGLVGIAVVRRRAR